jgi:hypothetical protein
LLRALIHVAHRIVTSPTIRTRPNDIAT